MHKASSTENTTLEYNPGGNKMKTVYEIQMETETGMAADQALHNRKMAVIAEIHAAVNRKDYGAIKELTEKLHNIG